MAFLPLTRSDVGVSRPGIGTPRRAGQPQVSGAVTGRAAGRWLDRE